MMQLRIALTPAAIAKGVMPSGEGLSGFAPLLSNAWTTPRCPLCMKVVKMTWLKVSQSRQ